jgi:hypothetical protein
MDRVDLVARHVDAVSVLLGGRVVAVILVKPDMELEIVTPSNITEHVIATLKGVDWDDLGPVQ